VLLAAILAGCGGPAAGSWQQVGGDGFRFAAPAGWRVAGGAPASGALTGVEVVTFRLARRYEHARLAAAIRELDRTAASLASQLDGTVTGRATRRVAGHDARAYTITFGRKVEEITFVLAGSRAYQLLCRRPVSGDAAACQELVSSFALV